MNPKVPPSEWLHLRVFFDFGDDSAAAQAGGYRRLLRDVVDPLLREHRDVILHYHFYHYRGSYGDFDEDFGVETPIYDDARTPVAFVRLRVECQCGSEGRVRKRLAELCQGSTIVNGRVEFCRQPNDVEDDIGSRFGSARVAVVKHLLQAAADLALAIASDNLPTNPHQHGDGGVPKAIHLVSNTLFYTWPGVEGQDAQQQRLVQVFAWDRDYWFYLPLP